MYPVSDAYKTAMKAVEQEHKIYGTIGGIGFEERNILRGSLTITNQCSDNEEIKIGQVYIGELKATFIEVPLPRYNWKGIDITVFFAMKLADGSYEEIPLGIFTVSDADWTSSGVVVTAYDNMARFDKHFNYEQQIVGKAYDLVIFACKKCGVTFGMEEEEVLALPNGDRNLSAYFENDMETWRDYLSWLTQTLGCFATIDRGGRLVFRTYGGEPVDVIDDSHRFQGASFSDYETRYTGMSVVNMKTKMTNYYHVTPDDGLTYNLGSNPFLQYGTEEGYNARRRAVLEALQGIRFVPFKATAIGNPAYDLGDVLVFKNGIADGTKQSCLTKYVFGYNSRYEMQCGGKDPALASARSKSDKNIAGLLSGVKTNDIVVYSYINVFAYMIGQKEKTIISINYAAVVNTHPIFIATIPFIADRDGYVVFRYYLDGVLMPDDTVRQYVSRGEHFVTLSNNMAAEANTRHTLVIKACTEYVESDLRQQAAKIMSFEHYISTGEYVVQDIDTTIPTVTIAKNTIRAVLYAQGLARTGNWDGTINISDVLAPITTGQRSVAMFSEFMGLTTQEPIRAATVTEQFRAISIGKMTVGGIGAAITVDEKEEIE